MNPERIFDFIIDTHPQIADYQQAVDIKAIFRTPGEYAKPNKIFYNDSEKQKEELQKFINDLDATGRAYCLYYSVYTFNPDDGKTITKDCAVSTQIVVADLDHITESEFIPILEKLKENGLEPTYSIFSGHGYQLIYKLTNASTDKELLAKFTEALKANGYPVDEKIKDCARVMRLPYTTNNKNPEEPVETYIYSHSGKIYSLQELKNKLNIIEENPANENLTAYDDNFLQETYSIKAVELPEPIKAVLMGLRNGKTDKQIRGLVLYLRDYEGMSLEEITGIAETMANISNDYTGDVIPDIQRKVKALFYHYDYKFNYDDLKEFGSMSGRVIDRSNLKLHNSSLKEDISNKAFYIYLRLIIISQYEKRIAFTAEEISDVCNITVRRLRARLEELAKAGLIDKRRANKKAGGKYLYTVSKFGIDKSKGYTNININVLSNMIKAVDDKIINETVIKFLLYMKRITQGIDGIEISQTEIARQLNIKQESVSKLWKKIEKLNKSSVCPYIRREKTWIDKDLYSFYYEIYY